jgi:RimJ/RimL family protein N-acetyltransferase
MSVLETQRLRLRRYTEADAPFILKLLNEPSWIANIGQRKVHSLADARTWIRERLIGNYERQGFGFWAVERRQDDALMGMCGLVKRDTLPDVDLGYAFLPAFWGHGYAREAAGACLDYARNELGLRRLLAITGPDNAPSARVLETIGMRHEDTRVLAGEERATRVFAIDF